MLNIQDCYKYKNKSIDKVNNFAVHPLTDKSLKEYLSNASYVNKFIDKSKMLKSNDCQCIITDDYENECNSQRKHCDSNKSINKKSTLLANYCLSGTKNTRNINLLNLDLHHQLTDDKSFFKLVNRYKTSRNKTFKNTNNIPKNNLKSLLELKNTHHPKDIESEKGKNVENNNTLKEDNYGKILILLIIIF